MKPTDRSISPQISRNTSPAAMIDDARRAEGFEKSVTRFAFEMKSEEDPLVDAK